MCGVVTLCMSPGISVGTCVANVTVRNERPSPAVRQRSSRTSRRGRFGEGGRRGWWWVVCSVGRKGGGLGGLGFGAPVGERRAAERHCSNELNEVELGPGLERRREQAGQGGRPRGPLEDASGSGARYRTIRKCTGAPSGSGLTVAFGPRAVREQRQGKVVAQDLDVPFSFRRSHGRSGLAQAHPVPQSIS